jgi:phosphoglucosamine mutase
MKFFGSSGIRAIFSDKLLETAFQVGVAVGKMYCSVVVARDTRTSGDAMKKAVISGLQAAEAKCADAGITPTPTLAYITREFDAGIMITASHNPPEYNGLKLLNPNGSSFDSLQQKMIESTISGISPGIQGLNPGGHKEPSAVYTGAIEKHLNGISAAFPEKLKVKVVVDASGGAGSQVTPRLLEKLGCEVVALNCTPGGNFPRGSEPSEENLKELCQKVKETGAAVGIAHDGDADRMMAVDEKGRYIPGDKLLAILIKAVGAKDVVTTLDASMAVDEMGLKVRRTKIGDTWVSEELKKGGDFGGETSGAWIFPQISLCPDGIYAAAKIVSIAAAHQLSELVDAVASYPIFRCNMNSEGLNFPVMESRLLSLKPRAVNKIDGLKLDFKSGWLLIRPSGTEPKVRITAEAKTEKSAREYFDIGITAVKKFTSTGEKTH